MEVYEATGYVITVGSESLRVRCRGKIVESVVSAPPLSNPESNSLNYLVAVLRGQLNPDGDLNSLDTNIIVMQIPNAPRRSAQTGRTISLTQLP